MIVDNVRIMIRGEAVGFDQNRITFVLHLTGAMTEDDIFEAIYWVYVKV